jgi:predicted helicase
VPVLQALFHQVSNPLQLQALGLMEPLNWAGEALNRVDQAAFFSRFDRDQAVQYFYEPFLEAYDAELRKDLGVWYTPPEIVKYMVARVDAVLRTELGLSDSLADPSVYVLDPCCGTGAYPLEVLRCIEQTLRAKGGDALLAQDLKQAAQQRIFGFEILPAPFVIAHLQIGLQLHVAGAAFEEGERAGIFLTNALTGWSDKAPQAKLPLAEFQDERDQADHIKQKVPILVILGNPPYNAFAGVAQTVEEQDLVQPYKEGLISQWGIKKFNLDDLYVRFFRLAERRIAEIAERGVVCFISNYSYLADPSFVVMRQRFLQEFDALWFDCLNGDSRETGKLTPEGKPDPSVFSTEYNHEGIRVGTNIIVINREQIILNLWGLR